MGLPSCHILASACSYILFAAVTLGVLAVPPVAMWLDPWKWEWPQIFFCITVNFAFLVYL